MKKDWKYILYISLAVGAFALIRLSSAKQYNWTVTFLPSDRNPYGAYVLAELLPGLFGESRIDHPFRTLYELQDSLQGRGNVISISMRFRCDRADTEALLTHVHNGGTAFISAQHFAGHLTDSLNIRTYDSFFGNNKFQSRSDSSSLRFISDSFDSQVRYFYRGDNIHNYFVVPDSLKASVIAVDEEDLPVAIRVKWGDGSLILNSTPMAFTNIYMLAGDNHEFASKLLSHLPEENVYWTGYYHSGRRESLTPLRFILQTEPLAWAYYITLITVLVYMLFELKRRQRIIPVIEPLENSTLEFVSTVGNLYYQNKEHRNIAEKKILFLFEQIRSRYSINTNKHDQLFLEVLSKKSGQPLDRITELFAVVARVREKKAISSQELIELNALIESCKL